MRGASAPASARTTSNATQLPVAAIGAGPVGFAAVAHPLERGETPLVLEAGPSVGATVRQRSHVRMFSNEDCARDSAPFSSGSESRWRNARPARHVKPGSTATSGGAKPARDLVEILTRRSTLTALLPMQPGAMAASFDHSTPS